jgi:ADP-ribosylglycohydrolase
MKPFLFCILNLALCLPAAAVDRPLTGTVEIPANRLADKIRGGLLGQILGNLNGLEHEMNYIDEPGNVTEYLPALPEGARTDDDTDFEWVYIKEMQDENQILLSPQRIAGLWRERINRRIWCSNLYARQLMGLDILPPRTGDICFNPWAEFNISGQFICETFGLIAPGMPRTAAEIGLNYTRVTIDAEPAQTTQLFTAMIATAFITRDLEQVLDAGAAAVDTGSAVHEICRTIEHWVNQHPRDWRTTRRLLKERYSRYNGGMRDRNGYELNTGATLAALRYGDGDFVRTLRTAFNFGWDADNTAATAGTVIGAIKGYRWMMAQDWPIVDRYRNTTRERMPEDETITGFADRLLVIAERNILKNGGSRVMINGDPVFRIRTEAPANIYPLQSMAKRAGRLKKEMRTEIVHLLLDSDEKRRSRAAYFAICLDLVSELRTAYPAEWRAALDALNRCENVLQALFHHSPVPLAQALRSRMLAAGIKAPAGRVELWR